MIRENRSFISKDEAHIWSASLLTHEYNLEYFLSILSKDERERAERFKFYKDKKQFIIARGILRCLLAAYLNDSPQSVEIVYGLLGKPCLTGEKPPLFFNISHSGPYALYAITREYEVGVDLECIDKNFDLENMAFNIFSPQERTYWETLEPREKEEGFFKIWVCKEAILKAQGKGWLETEKEASWIDIKFLKNSGELLLKGNIEYPYYFNCIPGYASALFVNGPSLRLRQFKYEISFLFEEREP
jgi:4'-phosphopantetheinyl transferase